MVGLLYIGIEFDFLYSEGTRQSREMNDYLIVKINFMPEEFDPIKLNQLHEEALIENEKRKKERNSKLDLEGWLVYNNPQQEEYQKIIMETEKEAEKFHEAGLRMDFTDFALMWNNINIDSDSGKVLKNKLDDEILVDLGCGRQPVIELAEKVGARVLIGVDRYSIGSENDSPSPQKVVEEPIRENGQTVLVREDLLKFVSHIPDNSANFTINGIDDDIIKNKDYQKALAKEIIRATKKGGIIFGKNSTSLFYIREEGQEQTKEIMEEVFKRKSLYKYSGMFEKK